jgi:hypothetical protein
MFLRDSVLKLKMKDIEMEIENDGWAHFVLCWLFVIYLTMLSVAQTLLLNSLILF